MKVKCNCGSGLSYSDCCEVIHLDISKALTAEALMRSRYTAFTLGLGEYLIQSHHPDTRHTVSKEELEDWATSVEWVGLTVIKKKQGRKEDKEGSVYFKAYFKENGKRKVIEEDSKFLKINDIWYYHSINH